MLRASEKPITGKLDGWPAGILYAVGTYDRPPVCVPGILNADFEKLIGVSMGTARRRAAQVRGIGGVVRRETWICNGCRRDQSPGTRSVLGVRCDGLEDHQGIQNLAKLH